MQKFKIEILHKKFKKNINIQNYYGQISIGSLIETFYIPIDSWSIEQYKQQWQEGIARIQTHSSSCLVYGVQSLKNHEHFLIEMLTLFNEDDTIFIHDEILNTSIEYEIDFPISLAEFSPQTCYHFVAPYRKTNIHAEAVSKVNNQKISEWSIPFADFIASIKNNKKISTTKINTANNTPEEKEDDYKPVYSKGDQIIIPSHNPLNQAYWKGYIGNERYALLDKDLNILEK